MAFLRPRPPPPPLWAYAYRIAVPPPPPRLETVEHLLERENEAALRGNWIWAGRVVVEPEMISLLIVTDSPDQDREINRRLESVLTDLGAAFAITLPLAVPGAPPRVA